MSAEHTKQYQVVTLDESDVLGALEPIALFGADGEPFTGGGGDGGFDISAIPNDKLLSWVSGDFTVDENGKMAWGPDDGDVFLRRSKEGTLRVEALPLPVDYQIEGNARFEIGGDPADLYRGAPRLVRSFGFREWDFTLEGIANSSDLTIQPPPSSLEGPFLEWDPYDNSIYIEAQAPVSAFNQQGKTKVTMRSTPAVGASANFSFSPGNGITSEYYPADGSYVYYNYDAPTGTMLFYPHPGDDYPFLRVYDQSQVNPYTAPAFTLEKNGEMTWVHSTAVDEAITLKHRKLASRGAPDLYIGSADPEYTVSLSVGSDERDVNGNLIGAYASLLNEGYNDGSGDGVGIWGESDQGYVYLEASPYLQLYANSNHPQNYSVFRIHGSDATRPIVPSDFNINSRGNMSWANYDYDFQLGQFVGEYVELQPTANFKNLEMPRPGSGIRLRSPDGNTYKTLTIDNSGAVALL